MNKIEEIALAFLAAAIITTLLSCVFALFAMLYLYAGIVTAIGVLVFLLSWLGIYWFLIK